MAPIGILLVITLMIGSWVVADSIARQSLRSQLETTAKTVGYQLPYVVNTGQTLISEIAEDPGLKNAAPDQLPEVLQKLIKEIPYFDQLILLDANGKLLSAYPDDQLTGKLMPIEEIMGIQVASQGMPFETASLPPAKNSSTAQISFIKSVATADGSTKNVLIGRTDLETNPFTEALIVTLRSMSDIQAEGMILDQNHRILVHPNYSLIMSDYGGITDSPVNFYDETSTDGTRYLVEYQNAIGIPWSVVITVPLVVAHQLALRIAAPLLGLILVLTALAVIVLSLGLRMITNSLKSLSLEAEDISKGNLDQPLLVNGEDEVAQLRQAFEKMRLSLKTRIEELNSLLKVSQGVSANLEIGDAIKPVLDSALSMGGSMSRAILVPSVIPELDGSQSEPIQYSAGQSKNLYRNLDEQILALTRQKDRILMTNLNRPRLLVLSSGLPQPSSLIAFALRYENQNYGCFWVAYDEPHTFLEEEVRYLATLASQAAVAAANSRIFLNAEIGRQRLEAILASTPDAVLVTDQRGRLILANPAAWQLFGMGIESEKGKPVEQVIHQKELLDLLQNTASEKLSAEITLMNDQVYLAAVSSVKAEGRKVGRVCVLRDVTQFKELDALKSEFVSTVSHDLRTPLALMRGYATMLEMVGQLNEQQTNYARKIISSVESMSRLVNNLLDLGRIEAEVGLQTELISASEIVERVVNGLQIQAVQKKIELKTEYLANGKSVMLEADPALLQQALQNLVENAIKFTRTGGKVTVRVQPQSERVVFDVSDTGIGISPMDQPRLFEKFYRGPQPGTPENLGSGLGLAIVRSIAERHHGSVWVESKLGTGSTFYLAIPLVREIA
jgi:PAS domain S-box-containing protein